MSSVAIGALKERLLQRKGELLREIDAKLQEARTERIAPDTVSPTDGGDRALLEAASGLDIAMARHDIDELQAIDQALGRIEAGNFGRCNDCDQPIARARLQAYPAAIRCATCQTEFERRTQGPPTAKS